MLTIVKPFQQLEDRYKKHGLMGLFINSVSKPFLKEDKCANSPQPYQNDGDNKTFLCCAGVSQFTDFLSAGNNAPQEIVFNYQKCVRLNDLDICNDATHEIEFTMLGLFINNDGNKGVNNMLKKAFKFWYELMCKLGVPVDVITVHGDKQEWIDIYESVGVGEMCGIEFMVDNNCKWTDGVNTGYCTEFFTRIDGELVEIGNIVNTHGTAIDSGFGAERLIDIMAKIKSETYIQFLNSVCNPNIVNPQMPIELEDIRMGFQYDGENTFPSYAYSNKFYRLLQASISILNCGILPSNTKQGYVCRKIIRTLYVEFCRIVCSDPALRPHALNDFPTRFAETCKEVFTRQKNSFPLSLYTPDHHCKDTDWWRTMLREAGKTLIACRQYLNDSVKPRLQNKPASWWKDTYGFCPDENKELLSYIKTFFQA